MHSLSTIPEPSTGVPKEEPAEVVRPLSTTLEVEVATNPIDRANADPAEQGDPDQLMDDVSFLVVLLIAGGLLRVVLGLLGPMQGVDEPLAQQAHQQGQSVLAGDPTNAYPLFDLLASGAGFLNIPAWALVLLGGLLTLAAVPAAYFIGKALTGRCVAGIIAAAIVAVHPAVLTASNNYNYAALAMGLVTIGFALLCNIEKRGRSSAIAGGILLGLAGLAAPLCWLVGVLAGLFVFKQARQRGVHQAIGCSVLVCALALTPAMAYRAAFFGHDADGLLQEWNAAPSSLNQLSPIDRLLVTMTQPSLRQLGEVMHLPLGDAGRLRLQHGHAPGPVAHRDVVADALADGWLLLNAALAGLATVSVGVMLVRRRFAETLVLAVPLAALAWCAADPGEALRLPLLPLVGVLSMGLLAKRSVPFVDEAAQEAKRLAKLAKREKKEHARQERELKKHKESIHAFDQPKGTKPKPDANEAQGQDTAILSQHEEDAQPVSARPI